VCRPHLADHASTPIELAFEVPGIDALRSLIEELGGRLDPADTTWRFNGTARCDVLDPEGNVVQLIQPRD